MSVFRFGTIRSPPRRPTVQSSEQSPFCTSPSQLQEVTLDPNMTDSISFPVRPRSPGRTSPIRGRTMKEYEEQLGHLQKENFNLKLRIYFLEERMDHMSGSEDKEALVKENIELKVKSETLRKELVDKQQLLCQAGKAVQLMEEEHQTNITQLKHDFEEKKNSLESHIHKLEEQLEKFMEHHEEDFIKFDETTADQQCLSQQAMEQIQEYKKQVEHLLAQKHQLEVSLEDEREHANHLEVELQEANRETKHAIESVEDLKFKIKERDSKLEESQGDLESKNCIIAELRKRVSSLEEMLISKEEDIKQQATEITKRDNIIEEKVNKLKEQQEALDARQKQVEALRSAIITKDSTVESLEAKYYSSKVNARNMELKLGALQKENQRLQEEINILKSHVKSNKSKTKDNAGGDNASATPSKNKWCYCGSSQKKVTGTEEKEFVKICESEFQEMQNKLKKSVEAEKLLGLRQQNIDKRLQDEKAHVSELESYIKEITLKLEECQLKCLKAEERSSKLENSYRTACQTLQESVRKAKEIKKENEQFMKDNEQFLKENEEFKEAIKKKNMQLEKIAMKVVDVYSKVRCRQKQQTQTQTDDDMQNLLPCCVLASGSGDNFLDQVEMMIQYLLKALEEKQEIIESFETKLLAATQEVKVKDALTTKLQEEICELHSCLKVLQSSQTKEIGVPSQEHKREIDNSVSDLVNTIESKMHNMLLCEVQEKNQEIERLNAELRKRTTNLQELVNKELWDKNREIEKLQDRLNVMCERKDLQIKMVNQQLSARDLQLKALQDKVVEFLTKAGIPASLIFKELQSVTLIQNDDSSTSDAAKDTCKHLHLFSSASVDSNSNLQCSLLATMEENKYLSQKVEELQERIRNTPERDSESRVVQNLRADCSRLKEEAEIAMKRYRDVKEGITILTRRLEELALFLSSLLQNQELLRGIGIQGHNVLKQALENSIELSRRFSVSFASLQPGNENTSCVQMNSFSDITYFSGHSLDLSEFWRELEKAGQGDASAGGIPGNKVSESDVKCPSASPPLANALGDKSQHKDVKELTASKDLITFTPPLTKSCESGNASSLSSMTFYNSCHTTSQPPVESSKTSNESATILPHCSRLSDVQQICQHPANIDLQSMKSPALISFSSVCENISKDSKHQNLSDSEAWSEPDRNVSMERIGLQEEHSKIVCASGPTALRTRNSRIQESDNSSEDTAQEERIPAARRIRYESGETKRLQNKLCALEQMNDALKNEVNILHELKDLLHATKDTSEKSLPSLGSYDCKEATNLESIESTRNSIVIPIGLLEQIQNQREKLESSILHNDLTRQQLETVILHLPAPEVDNTQTLWQKLKETTEDLNLSQNKVHQLELELKSTKLQLEESKKKVQLLETSCKVLQDTADTVSELEKQICSLRATVQEKDNEILERQCLILELGNKGKEQSIENEKKKHFEKLIREELEKKLADSEEVRGKLEKQINELDQNIKEAELRAVQAELKREEIKNVLVEQKVKYEQDIHEFEKKKTEAEMQLHRLSIKLKEAEMKITDLIYQNQVADEENKRKEKNMEEASVKLREREHAVSLKLDEVEKQLAQKEWVYKTELEKKAAAVETQKMIGEKLQKQIKELEERECAVQKDADQKITALDNKHKATVASLKENLKELEQQLKEKENELHRQLDDAAVAASSLTLERTKLVNEKLRLEQEVRRLEQRLSDTERNSHESEKQLQAANSLLEGKVRKLEEEKNALQTSVQELESVNAELEKNLAKINERNQRIAFSISSEHVADMQGKNVAREVDLLSPSSLSSGLDVFTGDGGSLPTSLWSLPSKFFDSGTDSSNLQHLFRTRQYSDRTDWVPEELSSDEYKGMVRRTGRQLSAPCEQQTKDVTNGSADSFETRNTASSPDLGIESDQGRFSSLETVPVQTTSLIQLETTQYLEERDGKLENISALVLTSRGECNDLIQLRHENIELKRRLVQTRKALEKTVEQLVSANQRKKQVEKAICKQLYKTHSILKQSRVNLQSEAVGGSCTEECK